jgi:hypothetical protein
MDSGGKTQTYVVNHYGSGWTSGFMLGYLTGHIPWYWHTPFHPAFYYSRPYYVGTGDTVNVYPPTFNWFKFLTWTGIAALAVFVVVRLFKKAKTPPSSSF